MNATTSIIDGYGWGLLKVLAALLLVCGVAYLVLRVSLRRFGATLHRSRNLRVVERCPLSQGRSLWIVSSGPRYFLIGETEGGIANLAELGPDQLASDESGIRGR